MDSTATRAISSTSWHESSHAIAAQAAGVDVTYLTIRPHEDDVGRVKFDTESEGFQKLDPLACAVIKCAGEVGERMAEGETTPKFNWFSEGGDAEDARHFIASLDEGDELDNRHLATLKAYALLRTRWDAVAELARKLEKDTTILGEDVARICLADAARRSARTQAAKPPPAKHRPRSRIARSGGIRPTRKCGRSRSRLLRRRRARNVRVDLG